MADLRTGAKFDLSVPELEKMARQLRRHVITMTATAGSGHPGGSLSAADIVTALYFKVMRHDPKNPRWPDRDRFILSKGHVAPILYAALAECGYFPVEELSTLRKLDSRLQGHTDRTLTPGVEMSAGSLGQGMSAPHFQIDNLTAIVDNNGLQLDGRCCEIMELEPLADKWCAFNWNVIEIDGHDMSQILQALKEAREVKQRPTVIIAHTVKGKGVSFMENNVDFHGKAPTPQEAEIALKELA